MPRPLPLLLAVPLFLTGLACQTPSAAAPVSTSPMVRVLRQTAPVNVAVLAVEVEPSAGVVPTEDLRRQARATLMDRGHSPLAPGYVDRETAARAVPAASLRLPDAGVLALRVSRWNEVRAESQGILQARVEGVLYDESGAIVAELGIDQDLKLGQGELSSILPSARRAVLLRRLVEALLAPLPAPPPL